MTGWQFHVLGYAARFAQPEFLAVTLLALLLGGLAVLLVLWRSGKLARLVPGRLIEKVVPGVSVPRALARPLLGCGGMLFAGLALAQPQCGSHVELTKQVGIDVVIAIDASRSMLARDVKPSRIERAKLELSGLLDALHGDRVGLVTFAGDAFVQCPLTSDLAAAKLFLRAVDPMAMPVQGTDVGRALSQSRDLLLEAEHGAKSRAIVLLSDGEDFGGEIDDELKALKQDGIRVIAVGIGSPAGEPVPELDKRGNVVGYVKDKQGNTVMTRLNEQGLAALADQTDGVYVASLPGSVGVGRVAEELDKLQKGELESRVSVTYAERFPLFLAPAFALLALGAALRPSRTRFSFPWLAGGTLLGIGTLAFAVSGCATLLDNALWAKLAWIAAAGTGALCFAAALMADLFVARRDGP